MEKSEILVHISAPSGVKDDARYRTQVQAILGFQPILRQNINVTLRSNDEDKEDAPAKPSDEIQSAITPRLRPGEASLPLETATGGNQAQKDITVQNNVSPGPLCIAESILAAPAAALDRTGPADGHVLSRHHIQSQETDSLGTPVSVIPDSQPEPPKAVQEPSQPSLQFIEATEATNKRRDDPSSPVRDNITSLCPAPVSTDLPDTTTDHTHSSASNPPYISLTTLPLQIHPPLPPISNHQFTTHITPTLSMLTERLKPSRTYKPIHQTRRLDNLERGYWTFNITLLDIESEPTPTADAKPNPNTWTHPILHRFWLFLSDFLLEGRAGWGVWCLLEHADTPTEPNINTLQLTFKIYAWGEIATHIYLLLFLASERRIRKMGAKWCDGSGEVVMIMP